MERVRKFKSKSESDIMFEDIIESNKSTKSVSMKHQLRKAIEDPKFGIPMDSINGFLSLMLSIMYFVSTYYAEYFRDGTMDWYNYILFVAHIYFFIEYSMKLYAVVVPLPFMSLTSALDFMTIIPYLGVSIYFGITNNDYNNPAILIVRMLDIWRLFTLSKFLRYVEDEDKQRLLYN